MEQRYSCPPRHKHATTSTCYVHHRCRCAACRGARNTYERTRRRFQGVDVWVPAGPSARRLQALACIGWSSKRVAAHLADFTGSTIALIREGDQAEVKRSTAASIAQLYERLCMTPNTAPGNRQTRGWARKHGWKPPLAYDDIDEGIAA